MDISVIVSIIFFVFALIMLAIALYLRNNQIENEMEFNEERERQSIRELVWHQTKDLNLDEWSLNAVVKNTESALRILKQGTIPNTRPIKISTSIDKNDGVNKISIDVSPLI